MPIDKSKRLQILERLQTVLQGATDAAVYNYPVRHASAVTLDVTVNLTTVNNVDLPFTVIEPTPEGTKTYHPGEHLVEIFRVNLHRRYDADAGDQATKATVWEHLAADLERALTADVTLSGLVYDTRLLTPQPFVGVGSNVVILVQPIEMRVHRGYGTP